MKIVTVSDTNTTVDINDCDTDNIYAYISDDKVYTLKYDKRANLWYFSLLSASDDHHEYENSHFRDAIKEAHHENCVVICFSSDDSFAEWITAY